MQSSIVAKFQKTFELPFTVEPCITQHKKAISFTIKTKTGRLFQVQADPADPIRILKVQIEEIEGLEKHLQKLLLKGKALKNNKTIDSYNLKQDDIIYLVDRKKKDDKDEDDDDEEEEEEEEEDDDNQIPVQIKHNGDLIFKINIDRTDSIQDIKAKLLQRVEAGGWRLVYEGKRLIDGKTAAEYNFFEVGLQINGDIQLKDAPDFKVNVKCQQVPYPVDVRATMLVKELRSLVSGMVTYPFILLCNGKILSDNDANLGSYGITKTEDIIVVPESTGGNCLKLMLAIEGVVTNGVEQLRESLNFLEDQPTLTEIFVEGIEAIKAMKYYQKYKPEELLAVRLWTSNILYRELNDCLLTSQDLGRWSVYLNNLMKGLKHMEYYRGKAYRGFQNVGDFQKGAKISCKSILGLTKSKEEATKAAGTNGILAEFDVVSARDISKLSLSPTEKFMLLPHSCFEVMDVVNNLDQPLLIKLREIPIPRGQKVLFWVDDNPEYNYYHAKRVEEEKGTSVVFCTSTKDALDVIESYKWLLSLDSSNFRVVSDMVRVEDGKNNYTAGIDLLKALFNDYQYKFPVMVFCSDAQRGQESANQANLQGEYSIKAKDEELEKFIDF